MKDLIGVLFVLLLISIIAYHYQHGESVFDTYRKTEANMKAEIGTRILYTKDTLFIVDYSMLNDTYTLSNGIKINKELLKSIKLKK